MADTKVRQKKYDWRAMVARREQERPRFETRFKESPYEWSRKDFARYPEKDTSWPGCYINWQTQVAFDAWMESLECIRDAN